MTEIKRFSGRILSGIFLMMLFHLNGQTNSYLKKKVTLPETKMTLQAAFKAISSQTGCVFSYDPTRISDNQIVSVSVNSKDLNSALLEILPKDVQYSLKGKYIVLKKVLIKTPTKTSTQKTKQAVPESKKESRISENPNLERLVLPPLERSVSTVTVQEAPVETVPRTDTLLSVLDTLQAANTVIVAESLNDTAVNDTSVKIPENDSLLPVKSTFGNFLRKNYYLKTAVSANNQLAALSVQAGLSDFYGILSIGSDYNDSYLLGVGAGANFDVNNRLAISIDALYNSLIAGKSYELQVRASNTQIIPALNYSITKSICIFAGPTINLIKSTYVSSVSTTDLGLLVGIGYSAGLKIDLKNLFSPQKKNNNELN